MNEFLLLKRLCESMWVMGFLTGMSAAQPHAETTKPVTAELDFAGKVLVVSLKGSDGAKCVLEKVEVRRLGDKSFLVGRAPQQLPAKDPVVGSTIWIAVDEVTQIWELHDVAKLPTLAGAAGALPAYAKAASSAGEVHEMPVRDFTVPVQIDPGWRDLIASIRLFVSHDEGKTWVQQKDWLPGERAHFSAPRDGLYWFAAQVILKDDRKIPAEAKDLVPSMKVRVLADGNSAKRPDPNER